MSLPFVFCFSDISSSWPTLVLHPPLTHSFISVAVHVRARVWTQTRAALPFPSAAPGACISMDVSSPGAKYHASSACKETTQRR